MWREILSIGGYVIEVLFHSKIIENPIYCGIKYVARLNSLCENKHIHLVFMKVNFCLLQIVNM